MTPLMATQHSPPPSPTLATLAATPQSPPPNSPMLATLATFADLAALTATHDLAATNGSLTPMRASLIRSDYLPHQMAPLIRYSGQVSDFHVTLEGTTKALSTEAYKALASKTRVHAELRNISPALVAEGRALPATECTLNLAETDVVDELTGAHARLIRGSVIIFSGAKSVDFALEVVRANPDTAHMAWIDRLELLERMSATSEASVSKKVSNERYVVGVAIRSNKKTRLPSLMVTQLQLSSLAKREKHDQAYSAQATLDCINKDKVEGYARNIVNRILKGTVHVPASMDLQSYPYLSQAFAAASDTKMHQRYIDAMNTLSALSKKALKDVKATVAHLDAATLDTAIMQALHSNVLMSQVHLSTFLTVPAVKERLDALLVRTSFRRLCTMIQHKSARSHHDGLATASVEPQTQAGNITCNAEELRALLQPVWNVTVAISLVRIPLYGAYPTTNDGMLLGEVDGVNFDSFHMSPFTTLVDEISASFVPKIRKLWTPNGTLTAADIAMAYMLLLFLVCNVEEPDVANNILTPPYAAALLELPRDSAAFERHVHGLFEKGCLRERHSRMQCTASGFDDNGIKLSGWRYTMVLWKKLAATNVGAALTAENMSLKNILDLIAVPWTLRGKWLVARELRLLLLNVTHDGDLQSCNSGGKKLMDVLGIAGKGKEVFVHALTDQCAATTGVDTVAHELKATGLPDADTKPLLKLICACSDVEKEGMTCDPTKVVRWTLRCLENGERKRMPAFYTPAEKRTAYWARIKGTFDIINVDSQGVTLTAATRNTAPLPFPIHKCLRALTSASSSVLLTHRAIRPLLAYTHGHHIPGNRSSRSCGTAPRYSTNCATQGAPTAGSGGPEARDEACHDPSVHSRGSREASPDFTLGGPSDRTYWCKPKAHRPRWTTAHRQGEEQACKNCPD